MAIDIYDDYVVLRMRMNGADGITTFVDDKGKTVTVAGNAHIEVDQSKFGGASAYFDGTGDYLSLVDSVDWDFGSGDFTIEAWVRVTDFSVARGIVGQRSGSTDYWGFRVETSGAAYLYLVTGSTVRLAVYSAAMSTGVWNHVAVCRVNGVATVYLNGVGSTSATWATWYNSTTTLVIGMDVPTTTNPMYGYIDDIRITKGVARYTADFTPPTEEMGMGYSKTVSGLVRDSGNALCQRALRLHRRADGLLIDEGFSNPTTGAYTLRALDTQKHYVIAHDTEGIDTYLSMEGSDGGTTFTEMSGKTVTAYGNAHTEVDQYKFGSTSAYFDGTGDYLTIPYSSDFDFSTCNFTIEFWLRPGTLASSQVLIVRRAALAATGFVVVQNITTGYINFYAGDDDTTGWNVIITPSTAVNVGTWVHIAAVRYGSTFQLFMDGASQGTATWSGAIAYSAAQLVIGASSDYSAPFTGYIDDLRITKGYARYTADFTAPTVPHFDGVVQQNAQILDYITPG